MGNVYLWKVDDRVVIHTNLEAAAQLDGLSRQPDKTITAEKYSEAEGLVRIINGKIVLGKTKQEEEDAAARIRIAEIDTRLFAIEQKMVRPMVAYIRGTQVKDDADKLNGLNAEVEALRAERKEKESVLITPF